MLKNTGYSYGWLAILLHWIMALAVFAMFGLGLYMVELTYYDAWYKGSLDLHKSTGCLLFLLLLCRIGWRAGNISPESADLAASGLEKKAAHWAHLVLYLLMLLLMVSGYLISTADGRGIHVFTWFTVSALPFSFDHQENIAGDIHNILAWALVILSAGHALAALRHHFINKDNTLVRMLKVTRQQDK